MHERRVFVELPDNQAAEYGCELEVSAGDSRHLRTVLRLAEGAVLTVVVKQTEEEYEAVISTLQPSLKVKLLNRLETRQCDSPILSICLALLKGDRNDLACEQLTQFGVKKIVLWQAQRSVAKIKDPQDRARKISRWQRICETAAKQSGQTYIPQVTFAAGAQEVTDEIRESLSNGNMGFFCSLLPDAQSLADIDNDCPGVHLVIGPEGDFNQQEEQIMLKSGLRPLTLGPHRFRSETAAVTAAALASFWWNKK